LATDEAVVREELAADGRDYDTEAWRFLHNLGHGHNLWTTLLVERGIVGVLAVTAYLALGLFTFMRLYRDLADDPDRQAAAKLGFLIIIYLVVAGLGNTTMIVEHGQAAMLLAAIAWGSATRSRKVQSVP
jgi:O-antigen ligase